MFTLSTFFFIINITPNYVDLQFPDKFFVQSLKNFIFISGRHKGARRQFTDFNAESIKKEKEQKELEWRVNL